MSTRHFLFYLFSILHNNVLYTVPRPLQKLKGICVVRRTPFFFLFYPFENKKYKKELDKDHATKKRTLHLLPFLSFSLPLKNLVKKTRIVQGFNLPA